MKWFLVLFRFWVGVFFVFIKSGWCLWSLFCVGRCNIIMSLKKSLIRILKFIWWWLVGRLKFCFNLIFCFRNRLIWWFFSLIMMCWAWLWMLLVIFCFLMLKFCRICLKFMIFMSVFKFCLNWLKKNWKLLKFRNVLISRLRKRLINSRRNFFFVSNWKLLKRSLVWKRRKVNWKLRSWKNFFKIKFCWRRCRRL